MIYEAVPGQPGQAFEGGADDADAEVPAFLSAAMAGVQVAVVPNLDGQGGQGGAQR